MNIPYYVPKYIEYKEINDDNTINTYRGEFTSLTKLEENSFLFGKALFGVPRCFQREGGGGGGGGLIKQGGAMGGGSD